MGQVQRFVAAFVLSESAAASLAARLALLNSAAVVLAILSEAFGETAIDS